MQLTRPTKYSSTQGFLTASQYILTCGYLLLFCSKDKIERFVWLDLYTAENLYLFAAHTSNQILQRRKKLSTFPTSTYTCWVAMETGKLFHHTKCPPISLWPDTSVPLRSWKALSDEKTYNECHIPLDLILPAKQKFCRFLLDKIVAGEWRLAILLSSFTMATV